MKTEYRTVCDKCLMPTWYETEQACKRSYLKYEICNLGHRHTNDNGEQELCGGTLRVIDRSNLDGRFARFYESGERVEVIEKDGTKRRFYVGKSRGWKPVYLEIARTNSRGGGAVYASEGATIKGVGVYR